MRLKQNDRTMHERLNILMEGATNDLKNDLEFSDFVLSTYEVIQKMKEGLPTYIDNKISKEDVVRCIGVKRTNANDLSSIDLEGGVALYPTYPLMNSHCYCNTRFLL